jgi:hypothetical protein
MKRQLAELSINELEGSELAVAKPAKITGTVVTFLKSEQSNPTSLFITACQAVKLPPTKRQASKWMHKKGLAYKQGRFVEVSNAN